MGTNIGYAPDEVVDKYTAEAEELGLSRSEYARKCIEIGRLVFQSGGEIDIERLRKLTEREKTSTVESDLAMKGGEISSTILSNLSTEEHRALTTEEIQDAVFGTEDEQIKQITTSLKKLDRQGQIKRLVEGGYIKTND